MRSTRLALLAVVAGAGLLGWSTAGVNTVSGNLAAAETATPATTPADPGHVDLDFDRSARDGFDHGHGGHHGRPGV
jgi:hypothetical protein